MQHVLTILHLMLQRRHRYNNSMMTMTKQTGQWKWVWLLKFNYLSMLSNY